METRLISTLSGVGYVAQLVPTVGVKIQRLRRLQHAPLAILSISELTGMLTGLKLGDGQRVV
jgi:hypothetical protein